MALTEEREKEFNALVDKAGEITDQLANSLSIQNVGGSHFTNEIRNLHRKLKDTVAAAKADV